MSINNRFLTFLRHSHALSCYIGARHMECPHYHIITSLNHYHLGIKGSRHQQSIQQHSVSLRTAYVELYLISWYVGARHIEDLHISPNQINITIYYKGSKARGYQQSIYHCLSTKINEAYFVLRRCTYGYLDTHLIGYVTLAAITGTTMWVSSNSVIWRSGTRGWIYGYPIFK